MKVIDEWDLGNEHIASFTKREFCFVGKNGRGGISTSADWKVLPTEYSNNNKTDMFSF